MAFDEHPYLWIYLLGGVTAGVFLAARSVLYWALNWCTKVNVQLANIRKLLPGHAKPAAKRFAEGFGTVAWEVALSWISVALGSWQLLTTCLRFVRELLTPVPEVVRKLRFPLRNNPNLSRESVWAHVLALSVVAGGDHPLSKEKLVSELIDAEENLPGFDTAAAISHLESLEVVKPDVLAAFKLLSE